MAQHFKDLIACQKAMDSVNAVYDATDAFPKRETYSLTDQIWRAAVSIPSTSQKGKRITATESSFTFFVILADRLPNSKLR
jgi:four helix bundle protein